MNCTLISSSQMATLTLISHNPLHTRFLSKTPNIILDYLLYKSNTKKGLFLFETVLEFVGIMSAIKDDQRASPAVPMI